MAQNHVWRYMLRLFHTFAIFENKLKNQCQTGHQKSCFFIKKLPLSGKGSIEREPSLPVRCAAAWDEEEDIFGSEIDEPEEAHETIGLEE